MGKKEKEEEDAFGSEEQRLVCTNLPTFSGFYLPACACDWIRLGWVRKRRWCCEWCILEVNTINKLQGSLSDFITVEKNLEMK